MGPIHPKENEYNWKDADAIVAFAQKHGMRVRGHNLCWHSQAPAWMFVNASGDTVSKAVLLQRLKEHITTVVSRYKGKLYAWDVVNEAISDKPNEYLRPSAWMRICGEEYIDSAFSYAHQADPEALLFYNDYNEISDVKRSKIIHLVTRLQNAGIPIHGIGLQAHWAVSEPTREQLDSTLSQFAAPGCNCKLPSLISRCIPKNTRHGRARQRIKTPNSRLKKKTPRWKCTPWLLKCSANTNKLLPALHFGIYRTGIAGSTTSRCPTAKTIHYYLIKTCSPKKHTGKCWHFDTESPLPLSPGTGQKRTNRLTKQAVTRIPQNTKSKPVINKTR